MKANVAFKECLADLIKDLDSVLFDKARATEIIQRWARNNFDVYGVTSRLSMEEEELGGEGMKAHLIRAMVTKAALEIASQSGIGEEEQKMPWDERISRRKDYVPKFSQVLDTPWKELGLSFVCLKRRPTSWYADESEESWMNKIIGANKP